MKQVTFETLLIITITSQYCSSDSILLQTLMTVAMVTGYAGTDTGVDMNGIELEFYSKYYCKWHIDSQS